MPRYELECGVRNVPLRMVVYGSEGIGKSTLAAQMPEAVFIDVEGGTNQLPVARMPRPTSWQMLMDEIRAVRDGDVPCRTLVIDTADAAEVLCVKHLCGKNNWESIESPGYGKGYTHLEEEFGRMLDLLSEVVEHGRSVCLLSHAVMRKFERPDESGAYDRFELKLSKKVAPKVKEWCDLLLFLDYKIYVTKDKSGKGRASGGGRVIRTSHNPCWDAKNRFGLPDEMTLDASGAEAIAALMAGGEALGAQKRPEQADAVKVPDEPHKAANTAPEASAEQTVDNGARKVPNYVDALTYPERLRPLADLMERDGVSDAELRHAVASKGYYPEECRVVDYESSPNDFCAWLVSVWPSFMEHIKTLRIDVPFDA